VYVKINGVNIFYEVKGSGAPVVTFHGAPGIGDCNEAMEYFSPLFNEFTFVFFDFRGSGLSDDASPFTYTHKQYVEDAEALVNYLGIKEFALFGGSYGGFIALEYALKYPERLTHLILRGTAGSSEIIKDAEENALKSGLPGITKELISALLRGNIRDEEELKKIFTAIYPLYSTRRETKKEEKEDLSQKRYHLVTHNTFFSKEFPLYDIRSKLCEISTPTLILAGVADWVTPPKYSLELHLLIPNSKLVIFEKSGHSIHKDEPEKFLKEIKTFLKKK